MLKKALFPGKYLQGVGALYELPALVKLFGTQGLILASPTAFEKILPASGIDLQAHCLKAERFNGEYCEKELSRLAVIISANKLDLLVAEKACTPVESIHHEAGAVTPDKVLQAILAADAIGQRRNRQQC